MKLGMTFILVLCLLVNVFPAIAQDMGTCSPLRLSRSLTQLLLMAQTEILDGVPSETVLSNLDAQISSLRDACTLTEVTAEPFVTIDFDAKASLIETGLLPDGHYRIERIEEEPIFLILTLESTSEGICKLEDAPADNKISFGPGTADSYILESIGCNAKFSIYSTGVWTINLFKIE